MSTRFVVIAALVALVIAAGAYFFWPSPPPPPPVATPSAPAPAAPAAPHYPIPSQGAEPLPALKESDANVLEALRRLLGADAVERMLMPEGVIRNIVATIDNLPREQFSRRLSPLQPVTGAFKVKGRDETLTLAPENAARYNLYVSTFERIDTPAAVALYFRLYPLFQQAYVELGYPNGYFNDRLIEVIDHLLEAPEPKAPVKLATPHVLYEFADPDLESRSSGQKVMMRIGAANEARVKAKLREIRKELVAQAPAR
jgi:hypothetical protein